MNVGNLITPPVYAQCPLCVITVGGGLFIAKKLGIDDLLVSIWISGLNTVIAFWLATKFKNKILKNPHFWACIFLVTTLIYLGITKQTGSVRNTFWGINKVVLGMLIGYIIVSFASFVDRLIRNKDGKVLFPYQKVIIPTAFLITTTIIFKSLL